MSLRCEYRSVSEEDSATHVLECDLKKAAKGLESGNMRGLIFGLLTDIFWIHQNKVSRLCCIEWNWFWAILNWGRVLPPTNGVKYLLKQLWHCCGKNSYCLVRSISVLLIWHENSDSSYYCRHNRPSSSVPELLLSDDLNWISAYGCRHCSIAAPRCLS